MTSTKPRYGGLAAHFVAPAPLPNQSPDTSHPAHRIGGRPGAQSFGLDYAQIPQSSFGRQSLPLCRARKLYFVLDHLVSLVMPAARHVAASPFQVAQYRSHSGAHIQHFQDPRTCLQIVIADVPEVLSILPTAQEDAISIPLAGVREWRSVRHSAIIRGWSRQLGVEQRCRNMSLAYR